MLPDGRQDAESAASIPARVRDALRAALCAMRYASGFAGGFVPREDSTMGGLTIATNDIVRSAGPALVRARLEACGAAKIYAVANTPVGRGNFGRLAAYIDATLAAEGAVSDPAEREDMRKTADWLRRGAPVE